MKLLIADAGSTKTEWALLEGSACAPRTFETPGVNALMASAEALREAFAGLPAADRIVYYGAGCATPEVCRKVADALPAEAEVGSDMLGAGRALLGRQPGLAAILGTGSNSASMADGQILRNMPPLGYILGDEGSGAALGRRLLREAYRFGLLRPELEAFAGMDYGQIIARVYREPAANRWLASLVPFIVANREALSDVIAAEFDAMFAAWARFYPERRVAFTGGVASALSPELRAAAERAGFEITEILKRPMSGLILYHSHEF